MFGWKKRKSRPARTAGKKQATNDDRWGNYAGQGIWYVCPDCGAPHQAEETAEFRTLVERICDEVGESSQEIYETFNLRGDGRWGVEPAAGLFSFTFKDGRACHAHYGLVASWNKDTHSWMWAWGMPENWAIPEACLGVARALRDRGRAEGWRATNERMLLVNEEETWHLTKLAAHVSGLPLVYRGKVNDTNHHYYAIARPQWAS